MKTIWLYGLSGAGKTTVAKKVVELKPEKAHLDGDDLRQGLCSGLDFSKADRDENLRRAAHVCELFNKNGKDVIASFITPYRYQREMIKEIISNVEMVFVDTHLAECIERDPKGLYMKALNKEIKNFTGISSPFEKGEEDLVIKDMTIEEAANKIIQL